MRLRRSFRSIVLLGITSGSLIFTHSSTQTASTQRTSTECQVTVSGSLRPTVLPAQDVWETTFRRFRAEPTAQSALNLSTESRAKLSGALLIALERAAALRTSLSSSPTAGIPSQAALDRDSVIADTILDARDDIFRQLPREESNALHVYAEETAAKMVVTLPIAGRIVGGNDGNSVCELAVSGGEYPHMIPESHTWRFLFESWARAASFNLAENGQFTDVYLDAVRRAAFRMSFEEIRSFLYIATSTAADVDRLRKASPHKTEEESRRLELLVHRAVMRGREEVLRAVTVDGWRAVLRQFDANRASSKFWYRSPIAG